MKNRANQILELLTEAKKIEVSSLAEKLGVSQVTVRKDLDALERQGVVLREHGFALLRNTNDISGRLAYHYEAKLKIARRAAELIADGDTLMIDESVLEEGVIQCPGCKQKFALDLSDDCCCGDGDEDGCGCGCEEHDHD